MKNKTKSKARAKAKAKAKQIFLNSSYHSNLDEPFMPVVERDLTYGPPIGSAVLRNRLNIQVASIPNPILERPAMRYTMNYSQPYGIEYFLSENSSRISTCNYVNGLPICERRMELPRVFSPRTHQYYFNSNIESCQ